MLRTSISYFSFSDRMYPRQMKACFVRLRWLPSAILRFHLAICQKLVTAFQVRVLHPRLEPVTRWNLLKSCQFTVFHFYLAIFCFLINLYVVNGFNTIVVDQSDPTLDSVSAELSSECSECSLGIVGSFVFLFCFPGEVGKGRSG